MSDHLTTVKRTESACKWGLRFCDTQEERTGALAVVETLRALDLIRADVAADLRAKFESAQ